jgi:hypothetical protein
MNNPDESLIAPIEAPAAVVEEFRTGFRAHAVMALKRQEAINASCARIENASKLMDGVGQLTHRVDADMYWHMKALYGADCWRDKDFRNRAEKHGLIRRVKGQRGKIISQAGMRPAGGVVTAGKYAAV